MRMYTPFPLMLRHACPAEKRSTPKIFTIHTVPVNNPQAVKMLHALADLKQRRSQLERCADVICCERPAEPHAGATRSALLVLGFSARLGLESGHKCASE